MTRGRHRKPIRYRRSALASAGIVVLAAGTNGHLWQAHAVPGDSMAPTIPAGSTVLTLALPGRSGPNSVITAHTQGAVLLKRVGGVGGDVLRCCDARGRVTRNGNPLPLRGAGTAAFGPEQVPPGHLFLLGDHLQTSVDSRSFGTVPAGVAGHRVVAVLWPPRAARLVR